MHLANRIMQRRNGRTSAALIAAIAAATTVLTVQRAAPGQTWLNPTTGNWSVGANWVGGVVPASSVTTQLTFNATGAQSYASTNNIAASFNLNRITFNNSGSGLVTIAGQSLAFAGTTPSIVQNSSGPVTMSNPIILPTTASTIDTTAITGSGGGTLTFSGAVTSAVAPTFNNGASWRNDDPNGRIVLSGGGNLFGLSANTGSITVNAGTVTSIVASAGINAATVGTLSAIGAGAVINTGELDAGVATLSTGNLFASGGGKFIVNHGNAFIASAQNITGDFVGSSANVQVSGANSSIAITGNGFSDSTGILMFAQGATGVASAGSLDITAGAQVSTVVAFLGERDGVATVNISGSGSQFTNTDQLVLESTSTSRIIVSSAGRWVSSGQIYTSSNPTDNAVISVTGTNSLADWSASEFAVFSGGLGIPGGNTSVVITAGGELRANLIYAAENQNGASGITVDGANSKLTLLGSAGRVNNTLVMGDDLGTISTLSVTNGGRVTVGANGALIMTTASTASANATLSGAGTLFDASAPGAQLLVGGTGTTAAGTAAFSVSGNAVANVSNLTMVYTRGTVNIGAGTSPATLVSGQTSVNGTINFGAGTFNTSGTLSVAGQVTLSPAGRNASGAPTNKKVLEAGTLSMTPSGVIDLSDNDAIFHSTSLSTVQDRIAAARNGGAWNAAGITSTAAKNANPKNTSLGAITGAEFHNALGASATFNGRVVANSDVLVKYTYYGDTDLNGVINFDDYSRTDAGFNNGRSGWINGDFDYNGVVNFDDYSLIDLAFNTQGAVVLGVGRGELAGPGERPIIGVDLSGRSILQVDRPDGLKSASLDGGAGVRAVPEPSVVTLLAACVVSFGRRRRRRSPTAAEFAQA